MPENHNACPYPAAGPGSVGWGGSGQSGWAGTRVINLTGLDRTTGYRATQGPTQGNLWCFGPHGADLAEGDLGGQTWTVTMQGRVQSAASCSVQLYPYDANGASLGATTGTAMSIAAGGTFRQAVVATLPAGTRRIRAAILARSAPAGSWLVGTAVRYAPVSDTALPYLDGDSSGWGWTGAAGASTSREAQALQVAVRTAQGTGTAVVTKPPGAAADVEPTSLTFRGTSGTVVAAIVQRFRDVDPTSPLLSAPAFGGNTTAQPTAMLAPSVTVDTRAALVSSWGVRTAAGTWSGPATMPNAVVTPDTGQHKTRAGSELGTVNGASGTRTATYTAGSRFHSMSAAVRGAASGLGVELLLAHIYLDSSGSLADLQLPAGWTLAGSAANATPNTLVHAALAYKVVATTRTPVSWAADLSQPDAVAAGFENDPWQRQANDGTMNDNTVPWPPPTSPASGGRSGRMLSLSIPAGYRRYEVVPAHRALEEGDSQWFGLPVRFPAGFPIGFDGFQIFDQLHQAWGSFSPPIAFEATRNGIRLTGGYGLPSGDVNPTQYQHDQQLVANPELDRWHQLDYFVENFSTQPNTSKITVRWNGVVVLDSWTIPCPTIVPAENGTTGTYRKVGIYRTSNNVTPLTIELGQAVAGATLAEVNRSAPQSQQGAAAMTGVGSLGGTATSSTPGPPTHQGAAALSGAGSLGGAGRVTARGAATMGGSGQLGGSAGVPISTLVDDATEARPTEWTDNGATTAAHAHLVNVFQNAGAAVYSSRRSRGVYTLAGWFLQFNGVVMPGSVGDQANAQLWAQDSQPAGGVDRLGFEYVAADNRLDFLGQTTGYAPVGQIESVPYDPVEHFHLGLEHTGAELRWYTSPDGLSWTLRRTLPAPPAWTAKGTCQVSLEGFRTTGANDQLRVGAINYGPPPLPTTSAAPTDHLQLRTINEARGFARWLQNAGARGWIGEFGWVTLWTKYSDAAQGALWAALGEVALRELDMLGLSGTVWASGQEWGGGYPLGVDVGGQVGDPLNLRNPDAAPIGAHPTRGTGAATRWRGVNLAGFERGVATWGGGTVRSAAPLVHTPADFAFLATQHVDTVRLPGAWERLQPTLGGALDTTALAQLEGMLLAARQNGIRVLVEPLHNYGRYTLPSGQVLELGAGLTTAHLTDFWTRFVGWLRASATRSAAVIGLAIHNEPHDLPGGVEGWKTASQAALTAIRNAGDTRLVLVPGYQWSSLTDWGAVHGSTSWITDPAGNHAFDAHWYWDTSTDPSLGPRSGTYQQPKAGGGTEILTYARELAAAQSQASTPTTMGGNGTLGGTAVRRTATSAVLGGEGQLGGAGVRVSRGTGGLSGEGQLGGDAIRRAPTGVAMTGVGQLGASAVSFSGAGAALTGVGQLGAAALLPTAAGGMAGAGQLGVAATRTTPAGTAALTGNGQLSGAAVRITPTAAALAAEGQLGGNAARVTAVAAALAGNGQLGPLAPLRTTPAAAALTGAGSLTGSAGLRIGAGPAALAGEGHIGAFAGLPGGSITMLAVGQLGGAARVTAAARAALTGVGQLGADAAIAGATGAALSGAGQIGTPARLIARAVAALTGVGDLSGQPFAIRRTAAALQGAGQLLGVPVALRPARATMTGRGNLGAAALPPIKVGAVALTGIGTLRGPAVVGYVAYPAMAGVGQLGGAQGTIAAVAWTPVFVRPAGPVLEQVPIPTTTLLVVETITGRVVARFPYTSLSWSSPLNKIPSCSATLPIEHSLDALADQRRPGDLDPRLTLRAFLRGPYRFSLVPCLGSRPLMGGPLLPSDDVNADRIVAQGVGLERMCEKRVLNRVNGTGTHADASRDVAFSATTVGGAIYRLISEAVNTYSGARPRRALPIVCSRPPDLLGDRNFAWPSYDVVKVWKAVSDIVTEPDGPDVRLEPQLTEDSRGPKVQWDLQIGRPYLPASGVAGPEGPLPWTFTPANDKITRTVDPAGMATTFYVTGDGQDRAKLVARAESTALTSLDFPELEEVETASSEGGDAGLEAVQRDADSLVRAHSRPTDTVKIEIPVDGSPDVSQVRRGDLARIDLRGKFYGDNDAQFRRITEISASSGSRFATLTCDIDEAVGV